jgi:hypothetical protein
MLGICFFIREGYYAWEPVWEGEKGVDAFRADPEWIEAKAVSETAGGGSLTIPDGVKSVLMTAKDFSPVK